MEQLQLFTDEPSSKPKPLAKREYTVQRYRLSYVKEKQAPDQRITVTRRDDVVGFCKRALADLPFETACIIAVDGGNRIIGYTAMEGDVNQCGVYPANCFRFLLCAGAAAFFIAHNHPGGNLVYSQADWDITKKLKKGGEVLGIPLLDHILITESASKSIRDDARWNTL